VLFAKLQEVHYILRDSDKWVLTAKGKLAGGRIKNSAKLGTYIEWPESFTLNELPLHQSPDMPIELISATMLGKQFGLSANILNHLLSELGWVDKGLKGWFATTQGLKQGAIQSEDSRSGVPYVKWPVSISQSKLLLTSINGMSVTVKSSQTTPSASTNTANLLKADKNGATYNAIDGHNVHSKAAMVIDNWLYMAEIVHAYQRRLPIEEIVYCDFYLPAGKVYIEYWQDNLELKTLALKQKKLTVYQKYGLRLIELNQQDMPNLDEVLTRMLLRFDIKAY
jgi:hypothetical protein